jgi:hypothetical protein
MGIFGTPFFICSSEFLFTKPWRFLSIGEVFISLGRFPSIREFFLWEQNAGFAPPSSRPSCRRHVGHF